MNKVIKKAIGCAAWILVYAVVNVWLLVPAAELIKDYKVGQVMDKPLDFNGAQALLRKPSASLKLLKTNSNIRTKWFVIVAIVSILILILILYIKYADFGYQQGINYAKGNETNGSARWMEFEELKKILNVGTGKGILYGKSNGCMVTLPIDNYEFNKNIAVFGGPGSGKSRKFVRNNIIQLAQLGQSMVITDPKGELFQDMERFLEESGYVVKVFNLVNTMLMYSDRWNPLAEVTDELTAQVFTEIVMANTEEGKKDAAFWSRAEQNLLKALVLYVVKEYPEEKRNLTSVYELLTLDEPKKLDKAFQMLPNSHPAKMAYNIYSQAGDSIKPGVVIGLGTRLQVFQIGIVQALTEKSDIDTKLPAEKKCAYFCITSDKDSTFNFLGSLFYSFLFINLTNYADLNGGKCKKQIYFLLDEFPNIGQIPDFIKKISTMRSRGINCFVIFQNIGQLQNRYPDNGWSEILGSCDSELFLGATDLLTLEYVNKILGEATVRTVSKTKRAGFEGFMDYGNVSTKTLNRSLMNPDELRRLPNDKAILILKGQQPIKLDKMDFSEHKLAAKLKGKTRLISDYQNEWYQKYLEKENHIKEIIKADNKQEPKRDIKPETNKESKVELKKETQKQNNNQETEYANVKDVKCPVCNSSIVEVKGSYKCSNPECRFNIPNSYGYKKITHDILKKLIDDKETEEIDGFKTEKGENYKGKLILHIREDGTASIRGKGSLEN